jgi:hypothetical protein
VSLPAILKRAANAGMDLSARAAAVRLASIDALWNPSSGLAGRFHRHASAALFAALILCATLAPRASALTLIDPVTDPLLSPPAQAGKPVVVQLTLDVLNIPSIDEVGEQFTLDGYLFAKWSDPRLAFKSSGAEDVEKIYNVGEIWMPSFEMINAAGPRQQSDRSLTVAPDGTAHYSERFHAALPSRFSMRRFPFDRQSLEVHFHPFFNDVALESFIVDVKDSGLSLEQRTYSSLAQWHVVGISAYTGSTRQFRSFAIPEAVFSIGVERRYSFYLWKVFLPLLLMVFLSWAVFWLDPSDLSNQVQIAVTTILTVIAFAFAISATMPRVSYLTFIDAFFLTCYVFVFIAIVELMTVHAAHRRGADLSRRIRRVSRWLVPAAFFATNVVLIVAFLG